MARRCEMCYNKILRLKEYKGYTHINIQQNPQKHYFCSRECKLKWIHYTISHEEQTVLEAFV